MGISIEEEKKIKDRLTEIQEGTTSLKLTFRTIERACDIAFMKMNAMGLEDNATNGARLIITTASLQDDRPRATWVTMEVTKEEWRSVLITRSSTSRIWDGQMFALRFTELQQKRILEYAETFYGL